MKARREAGELKDGVGREETEAGGTMGYVGIKGAPLMEEPSDVQEIRELESGDGEEHE